MGEVAAQRALIGEVLGALGVGGVTTLALLVGYGIGWVVTRCLGKDEDAP